MKKLITLCALLLSSLIAQDPPEEFQFNQSTIQAFYFFNEVTLNGVPVESDDWVGAFNGDVCVGARQWDTAICSGGSCDVPVMGNDWSEYTAGYMQNGDIPTFKIFDTSSGTFFDAIPSTEVDSWSNFGFFMNDLLEGGTASADCFGVPGGDAWVSDCGCVSSSNSGDDCDDCAGTPNGSAVVDECGVCGGENICEDEVEECNPGYITDCVDNDCCPESWIGDGYGDCEDQAYGCDLTCYDNDGGDCDGELYNGGTNENGAERQSSPYSNSRDDCFVIGPDADECGVCFGDGIGEGTCDCDGNVADCAGECGGDNGDMDCAGECGGGAEVDCAGVCGGTAEIDECGECGGNGPPENFDCDGNCNAFVDCAGICGGGAEFDCAGECGGGIEVDCAGECGGAAEIDCNGECGGDLEEDCLGICGGDSVLSGCDNTCGSDLEEDCLGICGGDAEVDCAGECGGGAEVDCAGECGGGAEVDCAGVCGGTAEIDECGVCGGDGSDDVGCGCFEAGPSGCDNTCGSTLENDACGVCGGDNGDMDCAGECGGGAEVDCAGECGGGAYIDCAGECGGSAEIDECGICNGNGAIYECGCYELEEGHDCDGNCIAPIDCAGICGGDSVLSGCDNICNSTAAVDCNGECGGIAVIDDCEICTGGSTGIVFNNTLDCAGECGGEAIEDACGVCNGGETNPDNCSDTIIRIPQDYSTIQEGINAAVDGDTVLVSDGDYVENLVLDKSIVLASLAIYDNLDEWIIFDDYYFNEWVINNSHIENTRLIGSNPDDPDYGSVILITPESDELISPEILGFTIQGGTGTHVIQDGNPTVLGGGILADISDSYIHHISFEQNGSDEVYSGGAVYLTSSAEDWSFDNRFENYNSERDVEEFRLTDNLYNGNDAQYGNTMANRFHEDEFDMSGSIFDVFDCGNEESAVSTIWVKVEPTARVDYVDGAGQLCAFTAPDVYVDPSIPQECLDEGCGFSNNPFKTIARTFKMINPTEDNPITIHLGAGTYSPETGESFPIEMMNNMNIIGEDEETVIIDAQQTGTVFYINNCVNNIISDLTITGGLSDSWFNGGGLQLYNSDPTLINVTISGNRSRLFGGGIFSEGSSPTLNYVTVSENHADWRGGGIELRNGTPILTNVIISNNTGQLGAGGASILESCAILTNVTISDNVSLNAGSGEHAGGAGIYFGSHAIDCDPILTNVTITNNTSQPNGNNPYLGGGIYAYDNARFTITNSIIYNNSPQSIWMTDMSESTITISYSNLDFSASGSYYNAWNEGNINEDPLFTDPENGDYTLQGNSPCIDSGNPDLWFVDLDGTQGDMGMTGGLHVIPILKVDPQGYTGIDFNGVGDFGSTRPFSIYNARQSPVHITDIQLSTSSFNTDVTSLTIPAFEMGIINIDANNTSLENIEDNLVIESEDLPEGLSVSLSVQGEEGNILNGVISGSIPVAIYRITGDIIIEEGDIVYIDAGTKFLFDEYHHFNIYGTLKAIGTESDSIIFDNWVNTEKWYGFTLDNASDETEFEYVRISGAEKSVRGGGMFLTSSSPTLSNVTISNNEGYEGGGIGINYDSNPILTNVTIADNVSEGGGGVYINDSTPIFTNVIISGNSAVGGNNKNGGGVYLWAASPIFTDVSISGNHADSKCGGICIWSGSDPILTNVTIVNNNANLYGGGLYINGANPILTNSIVWGNSPEPFYIQSGTLEMTYTNSESGDSGEGNINSNPQFSDPGNGDYTLMENSPCIDVGTADLDGDGVPDITDYFGSAPDMGAYEFCAYFDECDICGGDGAIYECGCYEPEEGFDCEGNCILGVDCAGVCGGSTVLDCSGVCGGNTVLDECGVCDADHSNNCIIESFFNPVYLEISDNPYLPMNLTITSAQLESIDLEAGDEIGIFDGAVCVGSGILTGTISQENILTIVASAQNPDWPASSGYTAGNDISYYIYDFSQELEITSVQANYLQGESVFTNNGSSFVELSNFGSIEQNIPFTHGWNIMSFNMSPEDMDMLSILSGLIDEGSLVKVQNESGDAIEYAEFLSQWSNNIGSMELTEGYYIKVNSNTELTAIGEPVELSLDILLTNGWNIISYPAQNPGDALLALQTLIDEGSLVKVQNEAGDAIEYVEFLSQWYNNIGDFESGEGYYIKVNQETTLTITEPDGNLARINEDNDKLNPVHFEPSFEGNPYLPMNLYIVDAEIDGFQIDRGSEIGVFDNGVCVGSIVYEGFDVDEHNLLSIPVSMDDPTTDDKDGFTINNSIEIRYWNGDDEYLLDMEDIVYRPQGTEFITFSIIESVPDKFILHDNYPNPFNPTTSLNYDISQSGYISLVVYNLLGESIRTLVSNYQDSGSYSVTWDSKNDQGTRVPSGIYFFKLEAGSFSQINKAVLLK